MDSRAKARADIGSVLGTRLWVLLPEVLTVAQIAAGEALGSSGVRGALREPLIKLVRLGLLLLEGSFVWGLLFVAVSMGYHGPKYGF